MSKILSFRGQLDEGLEERIKLSTLNGKKGYKITKFQTMAQSPGADNYENITKIYSKEQGSGSTTVDFTESDLLAVAFQEDASGHTYPVANVIIFDNVVFNQDIYVSTAATTGTIPVNYHIELEVMDLSDIQATQLTLKSLRDIASR
jgi:hypothetical protein